MNIQIINNCTGLDLFTDSIIDSDLLPLTTQCNVLLRCKNKNISASSQNINISVVGVKDGVSGTYTATSGINGLYAIFALYKNADSTIRVGGGTAFKFSSITSITISDSNVTYSDTDNYSKITATENVRGATRLTSNLEYIQGVQSDILYLVDTTTDINSVVGNVTFLSGATQNRIVMRTIKNNSLVLVVDMRCTASNATSGNNATITLTVNTSIITITHSNLVNASMNSYVFDKNTTNNYTVTPNNNCEFSTPPKLTIDGVDLTFTENNGVYTLTVDGTQYQNAGSVSVSGTAIKTQTTITGTLQNTTLNTNVFSFTGTNNFVITCDTGYYYRTLPKLTIDGVDLTFTENNGVYTLTVDGTQYQNASSVSVSGTTDRCITIIYDFDNNCDFYYTDSQGNIISVNPPRLFGNNYLRGYIQTKNNAMFLTATLQIDNGTIGNISQNAEHTKANLTARYLTGSEYSIKLTATTQVIQGVDVVQNLTNCTSSVSELRLDLGSHTITLTANNDTIFNVTPVANYNNVDYPFTLNNDSTIATLEIALDVPDITLTITGSASVASLQGISNFYKPTLEQLQYISNHRYKWLSGDYSSERLDLGEYILNLKTVFVPLTTKTTEKVILGGNELDVYIHPLNRTYIDFTTPDIMIYGYYRNGFDIKNITSFYAMIPFYGIYELDKEYINKNIRFSFHIDLSNCNVEIGVYVDSKLTETLSGDCSIDIPYIMEKSLTPKTECFTEHLKIVVNEKTNCNNRIKTIKNDLISNFTGFIKGDVITDSIKATSNELDLLKQLFNEGVYNG